MKKVLLSLALTLAATGVQAQIYLAEFDGIWYQFNSEKMICGVSQHYHRGYDDELIGDGGKGYSGNINIPSTVDGYTVVAILANAFNGAEGITSVSIPSTVKYFGEYAFAKCDMPQFTVPASVDSLARPTHPFHHARPSSG